MCNGATAGCTVKYCHRRIVRLSEISAKLIKKYDSALKGTPDIVTQKVTFSFDNRHVTNNGYEIDSSATDSLVYLDKSEDNCAKVDGYYKTMGRECVLEEGRTDSCSKLCCGRGYKKTLVEVESSCNCSFIYCCEVKCETCKSERQIYECL